MKHLRCPKCHERIPFDETGYAPGSVLVFCCPACRKEFKVRVNVASVAPKKEALYRQDDVQGQDKEINLELPRSGGLTTGEDVAGFHLTVLENEFQKRQVLTFHMGRNVIGRYVRGAKADAPILTVDPSIDTTHSIVTLTARASGGVQAAIADAPSGTGTFVGGEILGDRERRPLRDGDVVTLGAATLIVSFGAEEE